MGKKKTNIKRKQIERETKSIKVNLVLVILIIIAIISLIVFISRRKENSLFNINLSKQSQESSNIQEKGKNEETKEKSINKEEKIEDTSQKYVQINENGTKENNSTKLREEKNIDGLTLSNISLTENGEITTLLADVKNNTGNEIERRTVEIQVLDEKENQIASLIGVIDTVKPNQTVKLNASITRDISNAYDFRIVNY